jgi:hypothetical protein
MLGSGKHNSMERSDFLFHSENGKKLTPYERQKLTLILRSVDENTPLEIDPETNKIIFNIQPEQPRQQAAPSLSPMQQFSVTPNQVRPQVVSPGVASPTIQSQNSVAMPIQEKHFSISNGSNSQQNNVQKNTNHFISPVPVQNSLHNFLGQGTVLTDDKQVSPQVTQAYSAPKNISQKTASNVSSENDLIKERLKQFSPQGNNISVDMFEKKDNIPAAPQISNTSQRGNLSITSETNTGIKEADNFVDPSTKIRDYGFNGISKSPAVGSAQNTPRISMDANRTIHPIEKKVLEMPVGVGSEQFHEQIQKSNDFQTEPKAPAHGELRFVSPQKLPVEKTNEQSIQNIQPVSQPRRVVTQVARSPFHITPMKDEYATPADLSAFQQAKTEPKVNGNVVDLSKG